MRLATQLNLPADLPSIERIGGLFQDQPGVRQTQPSERPGEIASYRSEALDVTSIGLAPRRQLGDLPRSTEGSGRK